MKAIYKKILIFSTLLITSTLITIGNPVKTTPKGFDPKVDGMDLKFSDITKTINIELPDGEFLELRIPIPYFEAPVSSYILLKDIALLQDSYNNLDLIANMPIQEYIQPESQQLLQEKLLQLKEVIKDFETRVYSFTLQDEHQKVSETNKE